ncbi:MAG: hypothetical protein ACRDKJ_04065 [Actinomycetota bacterium]
MQHKALSVREGLAYIAAQLAGGAAGACMCRVSA